jgi:hypothetical protein
LHQPLASERSPALSARAGGAELDRTAAAAVPEAAEPLRMAQERDLEPRRPLTSRHFARDLEAMRRYRPGFRFWQHVFTMPDGRMVFGSAIDGRLLASFPTRGDWTQNAEWAEASLSDAFREQSIQGRLAARSDRTAMLLDQLVGPVLYNATRGTFIADGTERFGGFLAEWGAIFERFGVPADLGLAQALVESGLKGSIRSEAEAIGFCQWLPQNWARLQESSPYVIEASNQTTQAPYCAAHLTILATKYGSLIPALSEHHAGSLNVGRTIMNGSFAGGEDVRERYFLGADLTLLVRQTRSPGYREVAGSYGPRSYRYAEMIFGNITTIRELRSALPQQQVFAMRPDHSLSLDEVASRTGLSIDEVRRFNPALINRVPANANLYLPFQTAEFGADAAFWHRAPPPDYQLTLDEFLAIDQRFDAEDWHDGSAFETLRAFETRFRATQSEEGIVMASVLDFVIADLSDGRQREILERVRGSERAIHILAQSADQLRSLMPPIDHGAGLSRRGPLLATIGLR